MWAKYTWPVPTSKLSKQCIIWGLLQWQASLSNQSQGTTTTLRGSFRRKAFHSPGSLKVHPSNAREIARRKALCLSPQIYRYHKFINLASCSHDWLQTVSLTFPLIGSMDIHPASWLRATPPKGAHAAVVAAIVYLARNVAKMPCTSTYQPVTRGTAGLTTIAQQVDDCQRKYVRVC